MFLYELAIELGITSAQLVEVAARIGLGRISPSATLSSDEVAALREVFRTGQLPPVPVEAPASAAASEVTSEPLTGPLGWGPPPDQVPPGLPALTPEDVVFDQAPALAAPPPPPPPPPPPVSPPFASPASPEPEPEPAPGGPIVELPDPETDDETASRFDAKQLAMVASVVVLMVALFGYMTVNSGPNKQREQQIAATNKRLDAQPMVTFATIPPTTAPSASTSMVFRPVPGQLLTDPAAIARFCGAARHLVAFELRITAGEIESDWRAARAAIVTGRASWEQAVSDMIASGTPNAQVDLVVYRSTYHALFAAVLGSGSAADAVAGIRNVDSSEFRTAVVGLRSEVTGQCSGR